MLDQPYEVEIVLSPGGPDGGEDIQYVQVKVLDMKEQPTATVTPNPGFYILATDRTGRFDTGYRVTVTDEKGDSVAVRMKDNPRFRIEKDGEIWIKKAQIFGDNGETEVTLFIQTRDDITDLKFQTIQKITIPIRQVVEDMLTVTGDPPLEIDSSVRVNDHASQSGRANIVFTAKATFKAG